VELIAHGPLLGYAIGFKVDILDHVFEKEQMLKDIPPISNDFLFITARKMNQSDPIVETRVSEQNAFISGRFGSSFLSL
jgi:hypothetical protein